jgi:hypothetical protein
MDEGSLLLDPDHKRKYPWLSLIGIAAIGLFGLVLMLIMTP